MKNTLKLMSALAGAALLAASLTVHAQDEDAAKKKKPAGGTVSAYDAEAKTLTVTGKKGDTTYTLTDATEIVDAEGNAVEIAVGSKVTLMTGDDDSVTKVSVGAGKKGGKKKKDDADAAGEE